MGFFNLFTRKSNAAPIEQAVMDLHNIIFPWQKNLSGTHIVKAEQSKEKEFANADPDQYRRVNITFEGRSVYAMADFYSSIFNAAGKQAGIDVHMNPAFLDRHNMLELNIAFDQLDEFTAALKQVTDAIKQSPDFETEYRTALEFSRSIYHLGRDNHTPRARFEMYLDEDKQPHIKLHIVELPVEQAKNTVVMGGTIIQKKLVPGYKPVPGMPEYVEAEFDLKNKAIKLFGEEPNNVANADIPPAETNFASKVRQPEPSSLSHGKS